MKQIFHSWLKRWTNSDTLVNDLPDSAPRSRYEALDLPLEAQDSSELSTGLEEQFRETPLSYPSAYYLSNRQIPAERKMDTNLYRALSG